MAPKGIYNSMEKLQRDFLWRRGREESGIHLVAWDRICSPKRMGGCGLHTLHAMNQALLCKWLWRLREEVGSLWRNVVAAKYGMSNDWFHVSPRGTYGCSP